MKLKKGDKVVITVGKDKGKKGKIERLFRKDNKVVIPGINVFKKHLKRKDEKNPGGIVEIVKPIFVSKIALICPRCEQPTRVGYKIIDKEKLRICRKCSEEI
ncbi:50S ribosomal protein L24 [Candidatus Microgenomates bacterium]|nr:50S ribosomal protein L24 [Candidatus Microgenomates bacterium]